ncbi:hypothetical protein [Nostoc sp. 'Peltigera malacea cyanobiont' DB3992]|uniref:hypothetical protein n=1 Tax=Nostoc sp. 'Peltigera malacea cyanobiont' DB3992 TaxID=1206980 RepID=UPI000C045A21|nr:hypothetical protein [Nostoc sp. 'Peltigera malacea cyanobiont' DB3992]PHM09456.1 hypothetical protein CK516_14440 [Nostoc sp. 'Peltigera malacea cyanobiont' DB3992]
MTEITNKNPTETYVTWDYDLNTISGWTNNRYCVDAWLKQFPKNTELKLFESERNLTLSNVPMDEFRKATDLKRKRRNLTEQQRNELRDRLTASRLAS